MESIPFLAWKLVPSWKRNLNLYWRSFYVSDEEKSRKVFTLVLPVDDVTRRVLLGLKKRGLGQDKYNGFGGKIEKGETVRQAAVR